MPLAVSFMSGSKRVKGSKRPRKCRRLLAGLSLRALVLISGAIMIVRFSIGRHIGHRVPFGFVLFTTIFVLIVYRLRRKYFHLKRRTARITRSATHIAVTRAGDQNQKKGA
jgi:hypothetical protein